MNFSNKKLMLILKKSNIYYKQNKNNFLIHKKLKKVFIAKKKLFKVIIFKKDNYKKSQIANLIINELCKKNINSQKIIYLSFNNPYIKSVTIESILEICNKFSSNNYKIYLFLEESQKAKDWSKWTYTLYKKYTNINIISLISINGY